MSAAELVTVVLGNFGKHTTYELTRNVGSSFPDTNTWLIQKAAAGIACVTNEVIACNNNDLSWAAYCKPHFKGTIRTIFEIR